MLPACAKAQGKAFVCLFWLLVICDLKQSVVWRELTSTVQTVTLYGTVGVSFSMLAEKLLFFCQWASTVIDCSPTVSTSK
jgi:hypothetical protein